MKVWVLGLFGVCSMVVSACGEESGGSAGGDSGVSIGEQEATIGPEGGTLEGDSVSVTVPEGALASEVTIAAAQMDSAQIEALPEATHEDFDAPATLTNGVYVLTPHGTAFESPVKVELEYEGEANVVLRLDDENDTAWEIVSGAIVADGRARFTTQSFSIYAVAYAMLDCQRAFCQSLASTSGGAECGVVDDDCGGQVDLILDCGFAECGEGSGCNDSNRCEAGCVSEFDCATTTAECGTLVDNCGNQRDVVAECENKNGCGELGSCTGLNVCGACTPYADCSAALSAAQQGCGEVSDGCGGTMDCTNTCEGTDECVYVKDAGAANGEGYYQCGTPCSSNEQCPTGGSYCTDQDEAWFEGWSCMGGICQGVASRPEPCADGCLICEFGCSNGVCNY